MPSINVGRRGDKVVLVNNETHQGLGMNWPQALEFGREMCYKARGVRPAEAETFGPVSLRREGDDILIETVLGDLLYLIPCAAAQEIGGGIIAHAHKIETEEEEVAEKLAWEQGLLQRSGIGLGLVDHPDIQKMAGQNAVHDPKLRKYIASSGALIQVRIGTPSVSKGAPK